MRKIILLTAWAIVLCIGETYAQKKPDTKRKVTLWGHVFDMLTHQAVHNAKATLMLRDSTVVDSQRCGYYTGGYYGTDANYHFSIPRKKEGYIVLVQHPDYENCYVNVDIAHVARNTYFDAPWHYMKKRDFLSEPSSEGKSSSLAGEHTLREVTIKGSRVKLVYKGDTMVINAAAFKLPEGSMLDALVRQMPGTELKDDGTIYVNGQKVDFLTLNGKDFFRGKNKIMLDNLPLYAVDKVKVYHKSSEKSEWLGQEVEKKDYVMDVHLKRQYSIGYMANAEAAAGTDNRYLGRLFGLRFTPQSRLAIFGSMNNVNETRQPGQNGDWSPQKQLDNGLLTQHQAGFNLNIDDKHKRWDEYLSAEVGHVKRTYDIRQYQELFSASGNQTGSGLSLSDSRSTSVTIVNRFRWKNMFSRLKWWFNTTLSYGDNSQHDNSSNNLLNVLADTLYRTTDMSRSSYRQLNLSQNVTANWRLPWGDNLEMSAYGAYYKVTDDGTFSFSDYDYPQIKQHQSVNKYNANPDRGYNEELSAKYTLHSLNKWDYEVSWNYRQDYDSRHEDRYRLDRLGNGWDENMYGLGALPSNRDSLLMAIDTDNDKRYETLARRNLLGVRAYKSMNENGKNSWISIGLYATSRWQRMKYHSCNIDTAFSHRWIFIMPSINYQYNTKRRGVDFQLYGFDRSLDLLEYIPVNNTEDPLYTKVSNPDLNMSFIYKMRGSLQFKRPEVNQNLTLSCWATIDPRKIGTRKAYNNTTGAYTYMRDNVNGNYDWGTSINFNRDLDSLKRFHFDSRTSFSFVHNVDFDIMETDISTDNATRSIFDGETYSKVNNCVTYQSLQMKYSKGNFETSIGGSVTWRNVSSNRSDFTTLNIFEYDYGLATQYTLPLGIHLAADIRVYSRRGYESSNMNTDDLVCNASLSRAFMKGKLTARIESFDLFHELSNTQYNINAQGKTETWVRSIPSYLMIHLSYRLSVM